MTAVANPLAARNPAAATRAVAAGMRMRVTLGHQVVADVPFLRLPVRIGRNVLNDVRLDFPFLSQFHAMLELTARNTVTVIDLGSRNGVSLRTGRIPPRTGVDLAAHGYEFAIGSLLFRIFPANAAAAPNDDVRRRALGLLSDGAPVAARGAHGRSDTVGLDPAMSPMRAITIVRRLQPAVDAYRKAATTMREQLAAELASIDPRERTQLLSVLQATIPEITQEPDTKQNSGPSEMHRPARDEHREQALALRGLRDLANRIAPGMRPLQNETDVAVFLTKLGDTLGVFLKCFLPLRDGYKRFESQLALKHRAAGDPTGVAYAKTPAELGAQLLNGDDMSTDAPRAVESTFADLMVHHVAMLDGVVRGVRSLLDEMSPGSIDATIDARAKNVPAWRRLSTSRDRRRWEVYAEKHGDLVEADRAAFHLIFGAQFAEAYARLAGEAGGVQDAGTPAAFGTSSTGDTPRQKQA